MNAAFDGLCQWFIVLVLAFFLCEALFKLHDERVKAAAYAAALAACANGGSFNIGAQLVRCKPAK